MPKLMLNQFSFNRGIIDTTIQVRSDIDWYSMGVKDAVNLLPRPGGGMVKRPGFRFVDYAYSDDADKPSRLVKFAFSVEQTYVLEFSHHKIRVIMDGALVLYPPGHPKEDQPVEIDTGYAAEQLAGLDFHVHTFDYAQTADVMYIVHRLHPPARLVRFKDGQYEYDHHNWRLENASFGAAIAAPVGLTLTRRGNNKAQYVVTAVTASGEESAVSNATAREDNTQSGAPIPVPDYDKLTIEQMRQYSEQYGFLALWPITAQYWNYNVGQYAWSQGPTLWGAIGILRGVLGYSYGQTSNGLYTTWRPNRVQVGPVYYNTDFWRTEAIYGINQGWGGVLATMREKIKNAVEERNDRAIVTNHSALSWSRVEGKTADDDGEVILEPAAGYRIYRSNDGVDWYLVGVNDGMDNTTFDDDNLPYDSSGATPTLAQIPFEGEGNYPAVAYLFEQRLLLGRTDKKPNTFWGSMTGNYNNFNRSTVNPTADQSYMFTMVSSEMNEIAFLNAIKDLLIGTSGGEFRAGTNGAAISANAPPNIRPQSNYGSAKIRPVVAGQGLLFVSRSRKGIHDLSYSLNTDGYQGPDITLWAKHLFRKKAIADMCYQKNPDLLLWVVQSTGELLSCVYMPDEKVMGWTRHQSDGKFESCVSVNRDDGTEELYVSVVREINGTRRRLIECLAEPFEDVYDSARPETVANGFFVDSGLTYEGEPINRVAGLDHLEGKQVACFADGNVVPDLVVRNGTVELPVKASIIHVGLPYSWQLEPLELDVPDPSQTIRVRKRQVVKAWIRFYQCRECFYAADAESHFSEIAFRTEEPGQPIQPFTGDWEISLPATKSGDPSSSLVLKGNDPGPAGILAIMAEVSIGD